MYDVTKTCVRLFTFWTWPCAGLPICSQLKDSLYSLKRILKDFFHFHLAFLRSFLHFHFPFIRSFLSFLKNTVWTSRNIGFATASLCAYTAHSTLHRWLRRVEGKCNLWAIFLGILDSFCPFPFHDSMSKIVAWYQATSPCCLVSFDRQAKLPPFRPLKTVIPLVKQISCNQLKLVFQKQRSESWKPKQTFPNDRVRTQPVLASNELRSSLSTCMLWLV